MTLTVTTPAVAGQAELEAARLLLERMGITPDQLLHTATPRPPAPTFDEYLPIVEAAVGPGTRRVYGSYWNRIRDRWGQRAIDEPPHPRSSSYAQDVRANVVVRRNACGGRQATEHLIAALRCLYRHAIGDGLIDDNPALKVPKPRRLPSTRRALPDTRLAEINHVAATTGDDPELDTLILRLHTETACRRRGALALRPKDLDPDQCLIRLHEKGDVDRWQPISPTLMAYLLRHAKERGAAPDGRLLRYRNGKQITHRRYDHLWARIGKHLPWVAAQGISTHWLRHTTLTWGGAHLRPRGRPRLRRTHRQRRRRRRHPHLCPGHGPRGGRRAVRPDRRTPSPRGNIMIRPVPWGVTGGSEHDCPPVSARRVGSLRTPGADLSRKAGHGCGSAWRSETGRRSRHP